MNRRTFLKNSAMAGALLALPVGCASVSKNRPKPSDFVMPSLDVKPAMQDLLQQWCDALLALQMKDTNSSGTDGAYSCPACNTIHGRCADSVYPLLYMADKSGDSKYLDAALRVMEWAKNVDSPDGAWTNDLEKNSWKGITVFASIARAEALHHHGHLVDAAVKERWLERLHRAAGYIYTYFNMDYGVINYPVTGSYAMALLARTFNEDKYRQRGRELAHQALNYFTTGRLLFGEGHPQTQRSPKGGVAVDLGYNVEESLPSLALYALLENDAEVMPVVKKALRVHLQFMLPDGAWDNSWGTRSYKWTYWGSRTSDGCLAAYALLADRQHPAFTTAAVRNFQLMRDCTHNGLLYGGPHYFDHGVPPCVHHTFTHAKALATVLDRMQGQLTEQAPLPRETGRVQLREFSEIDTTLVAHGPWRATVSGYDWIYHDCAHATGGALALLYHEKHGTLLAASLAKYIMPEANNMQPLPDKIDFPLTPRVEMRQGDAWFTNLYDLTAEITSHQRDDDVVEIQVTTRLLDEKQKDPASGPMNFRLTYTLDPNGFAFRVEPDATVRGQWSIVLPVVSKASEEVHKVSDVCYKIVKPTGNVLVGSNTPMTILESVMVRGRAFNLVPGFEAVPFVVAGNDAQEVLCRIDPV